MMSIDEAITLLKFNNKHIADLKNDDLQQLAEWLEDYKRLKSIPEHNYYNCHNLTCRRKCEKDGYNKAINEAMKQAAKAICIGCGYLNGYECTYKGGNCQVSKPMLEVVVKALKKLKAGGE